MQKTNMHPALLLLPLAALLYACGNDTQVADAATSNTAVTDQTVSEPAKESEPVTERITLLSEEDFGGSAFRIVAQHTDTRPNIPAEATNGEIVNDALFQRDRTAEELMNITITYTAYEDRGLLRSDVQKTIKAGDDTYDLVITSMSDGINSLAPAGYLYDLAEFDALSLHELWWCPSAAENMNFDGHIYYTTGPVSLSYYTLPVVVAFNKTLAASFDIGDIYGIVKEGTWTIDTLLSMTKGISADLDNNGKMDENDRWGWALENNVGNALFAAAGLTMISPDSEKGYVLNMADANAIDVIQSYSSRLEDSTQFFIGDDHGSADSCVPVFEEGRALFLSINMGYMMYFLRDMVDDFGIVPIPKYEASQTDYISYCNTWMPAGAAIPITCAQAEQAAAVMELLACLSYRDVQPAVYEMTLQEKVARDADSKQMLDLIYANTYFDVNAVFDFGGSSSLLRKSVLGKADSYTSAYEKLRQKTEKALSDMIAMYQAIEH